MSRAPVTIGENESVADAAAKLLASLCDSLPVVDGEDRYAGMFGLYDLLGLLVPRVALAGDLMANLRFIDDDPAALRDRYREVKERRVADVVDRDAPVLDPDSSEVDAFRLFLRHHFSFAVVEKESRRVLGIVSRRDAVRAIAGAGPA